VRQVLAPAAIVARSGHIATAIATVVFVGCSKFEIDRVPTIPVQVAFTVGGKALDSGTVILHATPPTPGVPAPIGMIAPDGTLTLTTFERGDGAPIGEYVVTVHRSRQRLNDDSTSGVSLAKYESPLTSDLFLRIEPTPMRLGVIQLD
jgi:hypothetical protein